MSAFYPILGTARPTISVVSLYSVLGLSKSYALYITGASLLSDSIDLFSGEVIDEYDETNDLFSISIDPPEEINGINNIDYVTTYTKTDTNFNTVTYLLGKEMIRDGWDENKFSKMPYSSWYSINNAPISVFEEGGIDYTGAYGCYLHYYQIPVLLNKEDESSPIPLIGF